MAEINGYRHCRYEEPFLKPQDIYFIYYFILLFINAERTKNVLAFMCLFIYFKDLYAAFLRTSKAV